MPKRELVSVGNGVRRMMTPKEIKRMVDREIFIIPHGVKLPNRRGIICTEWASFVSDVLRADPNWVLGLDPEEREMFFDEHRYDTTKWRKLFVQDDPDSEEIVSTKFSIRKDGVVRNDFSGVLCRESFERGIFHFERHNVSYVLNAKNLALVAFGPDKNKQFSQTYAKPVITADSIKHGIERHPIEVLAYRNNAIHSSTEITTPKPQLTLVG